MRHGIIPLLADLMNDHKVRRRFDRQPEAVMDRYELSDKQKRALYTMNEAGICLGVLDQLAGYQFPQREFPITSENFLLDPWGDSETSRARAPRTRFHEDLRRRAESDDDVIDVLYPKPEPKAFRMRPRRVRTKDLHNGRFELNIYGQSFSRDATCMITREDTDDTQLPIDDERVVGTFRCSQLRSVVTANASGRYLVKVISNPSEGSNLQVSIDVPGTLVIDLK